MPSYFISHGGGPWPWVPQMRARMQTLETALAAMPGALPEPPKAVLMVSGHWETQTPRVMHAARPPMIYDYHGFPAHTYEIRYQAPGAPALAERTAQLIAAAGIEVTLDDTRGYDHGTFAPMQVMYPQPDMPLYQLSIGTDYDPRRHVDLGRALAPLRDEGVLIVGSGLSYHNLRLMGPEAREPSAAFDAWLNAALQLPPAERVQAMLDWETAPAARICHPQEDHLVPLFVALGAAEEDPATRTYHETTMMGTITASNFRFG
ncbi:aromatic ring-cleaving dioxygenase [Defluviimonas sp. 20V17]|uniref:Dioxygenase n=1 Tax=Allgaiera indica TaxID=765699 RepID=A0AAN4USH5_9RHOB|nr:class III extradiol ring-cleavage dioxygenase [Allgaiera indica]KDB01947.1 aromatic ring-cleaving dioxygenase [Defluviimonas sp. 20V17]GHE03353.1 dioxygenase [Allgaiera indica]SDX23884.1 Aromatic ring-opening dioxygenase, catalytic subunit, LigB family [Allgaiera indica]